MFKKEKYSTPVVIIETFDKADIITESPSDFDGVGYIPEEWTQGWNA